MAFYVRVKGEEAVRGRLENMRQFMPDDIERGTGRAVLHLQAEVVKLLSNRVLKRRTGQLAASINSRVVRQGRDTKGYVGTPSIYGPIHEFGSKGLPGGAITPKRAKFLAIPGQDALTGTGVARFSPSQRPDTYFFVKRVVIPERPYLRRGLREQGDTIRRHIADGVKRATDRGNGRI